MGTLDIFAHGIRLLGCTQHAGSEADLFGFGGTGRSSQQNAGKMFCAEGVLGGVKGDILKENANNIIITTINAEKLVTTRSSW